MCKACKLRGKTWKGSDPKCGFDVKGKLNNDNWNCATLNNLREAIFNFIDEIEVDNYNDDYLHLDYYYAEDQHSVHIVFDNTILFMTWYKSRGKTEYIYIHENWEQSDEDYIISLIDTLTKYEG